jgi:hypothetical protein
MPVPASMFRTSFGSPLLVVVGQVRVGKRRVSLVARVPGVVSERMLVAPRMADAVPRLGR